MPGCDDLLSTIRNSFRALKFDLVLIHRIASQVIFHFEDATGVNPARNEGWGGGPCSPREAKVDQYNPITAVLHDVAGIYIPMAESSGVEPQKNVLNVVLSITQLVWPPREKELCQGPLRAARGLYGAGLHGFIPCHFVHLAFLQKRCAASARGSTSEGGKSRRERSAARARLPRRPLAGCSQSNNIFMLLPDTFFGRHRRHMAIFNVGAGASSP